MERRELVGAGRRDRLLRTHALPARECPPVAQRTALRGGGAFTNAGAVAVNNLARWDGNGWSALGEGVAGTGSAFTGSPVTALQFIGDDLYVGGRFTTVGGNVPALNIASWNGSVWSALGAGLRGTPNTSPVNALASLGTDLYAFGGFTNAGGITANGLARWNGANWSSFGTLNGARTRAISNAGSIYVCGDFNIANYDTSSNVIGNHIIRWDGLNWHGLPGKPSNGTHLFVQAVETGSDGLYVGGFFNAVGTTIARRIARWDGTNWFALGSGVDGLYNGNSLAVRAIKARNNEVFVGGGFVSAGGVTANNIARWDGANWSTLGYGVDNAVVTIETTLTDVYAEVPGGQLVGSFPQDERQLVLRGALIVDGRKADWIGGYVARENVRGGKINWHPKGFEQQINLNPAVEIAAKERKKTQRHRIHRVTSVAWNSSSCFLLPHGLRKEFKNTNLGKTNRHLD